jgi:hypothetical protein
MGRARRKRIRGNPGADSVQATRLKAVIKERKEKRLIKVGFVLICMASVLTLSFMYFSPSVIHDFDGSQAMWDTAIVRRLLPPRSNFRGEAVLQAAYVDYKGGVYSVSAIKGFAELQVGKEAVIKYRRAKSGAIVVDFLQPTTYRIPAESSGQVWTGKFP